MPEHFVTRRIRVGSGAERHAVDAASGETLTELELDSPPVHDGMIAASGKLFISTMDGKIVCFAAP